MDVESRLNLIHHRDVKTGFKIKSISSNLKLASRWCHHDVIGIMFCV